MKNKKAFTLVELVIVISVIAILAAVLLPTFAGILQRAKDSAKMQIVNNLKKEYFTNSNMESISELENYIIEYENNAYLVGENGELTDLKTSFENVSLDNDLSYVEVETSTNITIYAVENAGIYTTNNTFIPWKSNTIFRVSNGKLRLNSDVNIENIKRVVLPLGITSTYNYVFRNFVNLESVEFSYGLKELGYSTFQNDSNLINVTLPSTLKSMDHYVFDGCTSLTNIELPSSLVSIGNHCFDSTNINNIVIPESCLDLGVNLFYYCTSLTSVTLPSTLTIIPRGLFTGCSSLTNFELPSSIVEIKGSSFSSCTSLTEFTIPEGVKVLESNFYGCTNLKKITLPSTLTYIYNSCFTDCNFEEINIPSTSMWQNIHFDGKNSLVNKNTKIMVNGELLTEITYHTKRVLPCNFMNYSYLTKVVIGKEVEEIGAYAFYYSTNINSIEFENNSQLQIIGDYAFYYNFNVSSLIIPNTCYYIGEYSLYTVNSSLNLVLPDNLEMIASSALYTLQDSILNQVTLDNGNILYYLGSESNDYLVLIKTKIIKDGVEINENCKFIYDNAFSSKNYLTEIILPNSIVGIGQNAFANNSSLNYISIPTNLKYCLYNAFNACNYLTYYEYENGLYLGNETTNNIILMQVIDSNITSFTIHEDCKAIYNHVFDNNATLETINFPKNLGSIGKQAFRRCGNLKTLELPEKMYYIGYECFFYCSGVENIVKIPTIVSLHLGGGCGFQYMKSPAIILSKSTRAIGYCTFVIHTSTSIFYEGNFEDFISIYTNRTHNNNDFMNPYECSTLYFYAETLEDCLDENLKYWHYDENNVPTLW